MNFQEFSNRLVYHLSLIKRNSIYQQKFSKFLQKILTLKPPWRPFVYFEDQWSNPPSCAPHSQALLILSRIQFGALPPARQIDYERWDVLWDPSHQRCKKEGIDTREQGRIYISRINQCTWGYSSYNSIKRIALMPEDSRMRAMWKCV